MIKKRILFLFLIIIIGLLGCNNKKSKNDNASADPIVKVGLVGEEMKTTWDKTSQILAEQGIKLELITFNDYSIPNRALAEGEIDLNSFQHNAFLENEVASHGYKISNFANTVLFFLGVYSKKITDLNDLKNGDVVVIMNDPTNGGRALKVLESAGVFKLDASKGDNPSVRDIIENPKNIKIIEVEAPLVYRTLEDPKTAAAVVNSTFVVSAGGVPAKEAIYIKEIDEFDRPYINIIVGRNADKDNELLKKVIAAYQSDAVKYVIENEPPLAGIALPVW
ncbi:MAG: MetQ/NlpA family ABC transporter substrate-binding protein [Chitinivibrionia bacterium]|nr:MetQ/NlpA family ABC transporter substrate-binding protein [Chitinivibrionia bacterium]